MSLRYKQIDQITFQDFEDFCLLRLTKGPRLDYKREIPNNLENLVAAFANTLGGLILLGVDSDRLTNEPVWPPVGMPAQRGIEERIIQICQDNIYPPVGPQISRLLDNPHAQGTTVAVIRVDESPEAPHAVNEGRHIYERTGNLNTPYDLANIDRIHHLLIRRQKIEEQREADLENCIRRAELYFDNRRGEFPARSASVTPLFPWRDLCNPQACRDFLSNWNYETSSQRTHWQFQRAPGGALAFGNIFASDASQPVVAYGDLSSKGHVFAIENALELDQQKHAIGRCLDYGITCKFVKNVIRFANDFYLQPWLEKPGILSISTGFRYVQGRKMLNRTSQDTSWGGKRFPDPQFRATVNVLLEEFLQDPQPHAQRLFDQLEFGFDVLPPSTT